MNAWDSELCGQQANSSDTHLPMNWKRLVARRMESATSRLATTPTTIDLRELPPARS